MKQKKKTEKQLQKEKKIKTALKWCAVGFGWTCLLLAFIGLLCLGIKGCSNKDHSNNISEVQNKTTTLLQKDRITRADSDLMYFSENGKYTFDIFYFDNEAHYDWRFEIVGDIYYPQSTIHPYGTTLIMLFQMSEGNTPPRLTYYIDGFSVATSDTDEDNISKPIYIFNAQSVDHNAETINYNYIFCETSELDYLQSIKLQGTNVINYLDSVARQYVYYSRVAYNGDGGATYIAHKVEGVGLGSSHTYSLISGIIKATDTRTNEVLYFSSLTTEIILAEDNFELYNPLYPYYVCDNVMGVLSNGGLQEYKYMYGTTSLTWDCKLLSNDLWKNTTFEVVYADAITSGIMIPENNDTNTDGDIPDISDTTTESGSVWGNMFYLLKSAFDCVSSFLIIQVLPGVTIGLLFLVPLSITLMIFIIKLIKKG